MRALTRMAGLLAVVTGFACGKSHTSEPETPKSGAPAAAAADGASSSVSPPPTASGAAAAAPSSWTGTYKSAAGTLYIPSDWKNVRWSGSDSQAGLGDGAMTLQIDAATGRVLGTVEGPLGPAVVDGVVRDGKMTASILRKVPSDRGFSGTLLGSVERDVAEGSMNLSSAEANAVRSATFTLSPTR
jgi:hypothetical protein